MTSYDCTFSEETSSQDGLDSSPKKHDSTTVLYKTELCRSFSESGYCRYGLKCRFAHGEDDLRPVTRHKKYKTEMCKNFIKTGICPYGVRCRFIHENDDPLLGQTHSDEGLNLDDLFLSNTDSDDEERISFSSALAPSPVDGQKANREFSSLTSSPVFQSQEKSFLENLTNSQRRNSAMTFWEEALSSQKLNSKGDLTFSPFSLGEVTHVGNPTSLKVSSFPSRTNLMMNMNRYSTSAPTASFLDLIKNADDAQPSTPKDNEHRFFHALSAPIQIMGPSRRLPIFEKLTK